MKLRLILLLPALLLWRCSSPPASEGIPPLPAALTPADADPASVAVQTQWEQLATSLGIGDNQASTTAALTQQLATPSSYLTAARAADYGTLLGNLTKTYAATAFATRCAAIDGVQAVGNAKVADPVAGTSTDFPAATLYLMKYRLQSAATGTAETTSRTGLLVIPTTANQTAVIAAYAHGGDFGLGYGEVAAGFGQLQATHVVVAPTFPGEPLCKVATDPTARACDASGILVPASGTALAYDTDADELLGMFDCVARAAIGKVDGPVVSATGTSSGTLAAILNPVLKRQGGGTLSAFPASLIVGSSRGGLVAEVALAKTGAALAALGAAPTASPLGPSYLAPSYFSCAAIVSAPASFAFAEFRLFLEQWVKGTLADTPFAAFFGMGSLATLFDPYRAGSVDAPTASLLVERRDAMLTAPLQLAALRNWSTFTQGQTPGGPGALLVLHGVSDGIVPISQAQGAFNVFLAAASNPTLVSATDPTKAPGISLTVRGVAAKPTYLSGTTLATGYTQHLDKAFFDGIAVVPGDFISQTVTGSALPVAQAEAAADGLAQQLFSAPSPSAVQLQAARSYILAGVLQAGKPPTASPRTNASGSQVIDLVEPGSLPPAQILGLWRQTTCQSAL